VVHLAISYSVVQSAHQSLQNKKGPTAHSPSLTLEYKYQNLILSSSTPNRLSLLSFSLSGSSRQATQAASKAPLHLPTLRRPSGLLPAIAASAHAAATSPARAATTSLACAATAAPARAVATPSRVTPLLPPLTLRHRRLLSRHTVASACAVVVFGRAVSSTRLTQKIKASRHLNPLERLAA
jgi:hypothetical protein